LDPADPSKNAVKVDVQTASVDTANAQRDDHLRNPDFFKSKEFPTMSFRSTSMTKTGADTFDVKGEFTLLGKTKPLAVTFKLTGPHAGKTSFRIKRSDYGMTFRLPDTADEVDVTLEIAGVK
jgi:polyisoprenoid-binding protein YceI